MAAGGGQVGERPQPEAGAAHGPADLGVAQGGQLKIGGTPSFFMNGMPLPALRGEFFDAAIAWELRRVSGGK